ncbi:unnamed protein product [Adineta ricciae]|uniref:Phospholipase A2 n=1 Tax=Adineta ricciae TaxID=249248 RepID=A0A814UMX2_ADIRI|nr:unnamed protein product [Adineta ricciae]CAF1514552.1 unnamed protein product [Adineta ricciae]
MNALRAFLVFLLGCCLCGVKVNASKMDLWDFGRMISHKGYSRWDYYGYGCWCGPGAYGNEFLDSTDYCCKTHDECYDSVQNSNCSPYWASYKYDRLSNGQLQCTDAHGTCGRKVCECDKAAADCFEANRGTYKSWLRGLSNDDRRRLCNRAYIRQGYWS